MELTNLMTTGLAGATVAGQVVILIWVTAFIFRRSGWGKVVLDFTQKRGVMIAFVAAAGAMFGSLFYSEIAGYEPCKLCWIQRVFMYPQAFILGMALWVGEGRRIAKYAIMLSGLGAVVAAFHYYEQVTASLLVPCSAIGYAVSCTEKFFMSFGYITIPMMALTAFGLIIVGSLAARQE